MNLNFFTHFLVTKLFRQTWLFALLFVCSFHFSSSAQSTILVTTNSVTNEKIEISEAYPNPASHIIKFDYRLPNSFSEGKITIYNLLGSIVGEYKLDGYNNQIQISVDSFKTGMYFYTISLNNKSLITKKFMVKH